MRFPTQAGIPLLILYCVITLSVYTVLHVTLGSKGAVSPVSGSSDNTSPTLTPTDRSQTGSLGKVVDNALSGAEGTFGVYVKNLKTGEVYEKRATEQFDSASLYKLWVMAVVYERIQTGDLSLNEQLSEDVESLNEKFQIASESAELTEGVISLTVDEALEKMITISDNYAALLLTSRIRLSSVSSWLKANDFTGSAVGVSGENPMTTARDAALFFEKLQSGALANERRTKEMLTLLQNQKLNNKLPKLLPKGVVIAHKTGELGEFSHDAGIVYTLNGDYIIAILSKSANPNLANSTIAKVSLTVYDYFLQGK